MQSTQVSTACFCPPTSLPPPAPPPAALLQVRAAPWMQGMGNRHRLDPGLPLHLRGDLHSSPSTERSKTSPLLPKLHLSVMTRERHSRAPSQASAPRGRQGSRRGPMGSPLPPHSDRAGSSRAQPCVSPHFPPRLSPLLVSAGLSHPEEPGASLSPMPLAPLPRGSHTHEQWGASCPAPA